jgi:hypothetical protein
MKKGSNNHAPPDVERTAWCRPVPQPHDRSISAIA